METQEYFNYRNNILSESRDLDGFIQQDLVLAQVLPSMLDAKLIESEECNDSYFIFSEENLKLNGYLINETGERLQLFVVNEDSLDDSLSDNDLIVSHKEEYHNQFKRVKDLIKKCFRGQLKDSITDTSPIKSLVTLLSSKEGIEQIDTIEFFLISLTVTVTQKNNSFEPRRIHFEKENIKVDTKSNDKVIQKEIIIIRELIDLNYLLNVQISKGNRDPLDINFQKTFGYDIEVMKGADSTMFDSYLCALNAEVIYDLYKRYSSRLLEKNVRSFLQFKGVNKGIRNTIKTEPEKFIAYNNGLTITATKAKVYQNNKKLFITSLEDFQIVNGGQTTATIYFSKKEGLDISKVKVMAKINVIKNVSISDLDKLITNISIYSNAQTKVSSVDLKSRNPQLDKIKQLSESIYSPKKNRWFFEKSRGEFQTLKRNRGGKATSLEKDFPKERRFSKEELAKYFSSWSDQPYLVKKGGEKIFRYFIEHISIEDIEDENKKIEIDRDFYEDLIAKIILFRSLEKIYGQGLNALGQIRSAAIPYSISVLYLYTDYQRKERFNFNKIWTDEGLNEQINIFFKELLVLMNSLIKKYSTSEDYGEHSKKKDLWDKIKSCKEIIEFMELKKSKTILKEYSIPYTK